MIPSPSPLSLPSPYTLSMHPTTYRAIVREGWVAYYKNASPQECPYNGGEYREAWQFGYDSASDNHTGMKI